MQDKTYEGTLQIEVCTPDIDKYGNDATDVAPDKINEAGHSENSGLFFGKRGGIRDASGPFDGDTIKDVLEWQKEALAELKEEIFREDQWADISVIFWLEIDCNLLDLSDCGKSWEGDYLKIDENGEIRESGLKIDTISLPISLVKIVNGEVT